MSLKHKSVGEKLTREEWEGEDIHLFNGQDAADVILVSTPPSGKCRVINVYYDPSIGKAVFEYDDTPV